MGRIEAVIPDKLDQEFRIEVIKRIGGKKGNLLRAITEAIELWVGSDETLKAAQRLAKLIQDTKTPTGVRRMR